MTECASLVRLASVCRGTRGNRFRAVACELSVVRSATGVLRIARLLFSPRLNCGDGGSQCKRELPVELSRLAFRGVATPSRGSLNFLVEAFVRAAFLGLCATKRRPEGSGASRARTWPWPRPAILIEGNISNTFRTAAPIAARVLTRRSATFNGQEHEACTSQRTCGPPMSKLRSVSANQQRMPTSAEQAG